MPPPEAETAPIQQYKHTHMFQKAAALVTDPTAAPTSAFDTSKPSLISQEAFEVPKAENPLDLESRGSSSSSIIGSPSLQIRPNATLVAAFQNLDELRGLLKENVSLFTDAAATKSKATLFPQKTPLQSPVIFPYETSPQFGSSVTCQFNDDNLLGDSVEEFTTVPSVEPSYQAEPTGENASIATTQDKTGPKSVNEICDEAPVFRLKEVHDTETAGGSTADAILPIPDRVAKIHAQFQGSCQGVSSDEQVQLLEFFAQELQQMLGKLTGSEDLE